MSTVCLTAPTAEQKQELVERIAKELDKTPIGYSFSRALAGGIVGNIGDRSINEDDDFFPYLTILGAMAGTPMGIKATRHGVGIAKDTLGDALPKSMRDMMETDRMYKEMEIPDALGLRVDPRDAKGMAQVQEAASGIQSSLLRGRNALEDFMNSPWVRSQFSTLTNLGKTSPVANKIRDVLTDIPNKIKQMKAELDAGYNARKGRDAYNQFLETFGPQKLTKIFDDMARNMGDAELQKVMAEVASDPKQMREQLQDAIGRFLHSGKGGPNETPRKNIEDYYNSHSLAKTIDDRLAQDPEFNEFVTHTRNWFEGINKRTKELYQTQISRDVEEMKRIATTISDVELRALYQNRVIPVLDDFLESGQTWKQYKDTIKATGDSESVKDLQAVNDLLSSARDGERMHTLYKRAIEMKNRIDQNDKFGNAYYPQYESKEKLRELKRRLMKRGVIKDDTEFDSYIADRYWELNYKNDGKVYVNDTEMDNFSVKQFSKREHARDEVLKRIGNNPQFTPAEREWAMGNLDKFIKSAKVSSKGTTKNIYYIEVPEGAPTNYFSAANKEVHKEFIQKYRNMNSTQVKKSSRLDHVRRMETPWELVETDIRYMTNHYANDVAPRLHGIENRMFDVGDLTENYLAPLLRDVQRSGGQTEMGEVAGRVQGIYNTAFRINTMKEGDDYKAFTRQARFANAWRNVMAMAYQYGIGFYNTFEHAVQTPTLTSWDAYRNAWKVLGTSRKAADAMSETLLDFHVIDKQLKSQSGNQAYFDDVSGMTWIERSLEKGANLSAEFSLTKYLGKVPGLSAINPDNMGVWKMAFGGFTEGNIMSTAINAHASLFEARQMAKAFRMIQELPEGAPRVAQMEGRRLSLGDIRTKMANYGIGDSQFEAFMDPRTQKVLSDMMEGLKAGQKLSSEQLIQNANELSYIKTILNHATESYHATNPMMRPERAMTPTGRMLFQYSTYSYNQVFQNFKRRIEFPITTWKEQFAGDMGKKNMMEFHYHYKQGNWDKLRQMGFSNEAVENYPSEAIDHISKYFIGAVGLSTVGHMTIDTFRDTVAYPFKEDEKDQWRRLKRRTVLNPLAKTGDQRTFEDMFDDFGSGDVLNLAQYMAATLMDTGLMGRYDAFYSSYGRNSLTDLTPVSRAANDLYNDILSITTSPIQDLSETATSVGVRNALRYAPILGSSPFSEIRSTVQRQILNNPKKPVNKPRPGLLNSDLMAPNLTQGVL